MDEIIEEAPVPTTPEKVTTLGYDPWSFATVFALCQAWPHLRREILDAERHIRSLTEENAQLVIDRARMITGATEAARRASADAHDRLAVIDRLSTQLTACRDQLAAATRELASVPDRLRLAEEVCASIDPHHSGRGYTWAWLDAAALDAWRLAR